MNNHIKVLISVVIQFISMNAFLFLYLKSHATAEEGLLVENRVEVLLVLLPFTVLLAHLLAAELVALLFLEFPPGLDAFEVLLVAVAELTERSAVFTAVHIVPNA